MSAGRIVSIVQVFLSVAVILAAVLVHHRLGTRLVIGLAAAIFTVGVGREIWDLLSEKAALAKIDREVGSWALVPGPGAGVDAQVGLERLSDGDASHSHLH